MKSFLKKYIKPPLNSVGIYKLSHHLYFLLLGIKTNLINRYNKLTRKTCPILLYHRIDNVKNDPLCLAVSPQHFEKHLRFLKENYNILPLYELSKKLLNNTIKGNEVAITFDDGYKDNFINALPLLEKYEVPATIFITTNFLGEEASFEWDMKYLDTERAIFLDENQIKLLSKNPLIEIGAHTNNHVQLANLTEEEQRIEIISGKNKLEQIIGKKIVMFAYPFGDIYDFNKTSQKILNELGFDFAYSNVQRLATITKNNLSIPRINIRNCDISLLSKKLLHIKYDLHN